MRRPVLELFSSKHSVVGFSSQNPRVKVLQSRSYTLSAQVNSRPNFTIRGDSESAQRALSNAYFRARLRCLEGMQFSDEAMAQN